MFAFLLTTVLCVFAALILYFKWAFTYWRNRNLPCIEEPSIPFGSMRDMFSDVPLTVKIYVGKYIQTLYALGRSQGYKHAGIYRLTKPLYFAIDVEYIKNILQRDFNKFTERGFYYNEKDDPLSANLFAIGGEKWQLIRKKLSPTFTSGKLKSMLPGLIDCGYQMQGAVDKAWKSGETIDAKMISECFTIDVIGSCAFGVDCNSFKDPDAEFRKQGKKIFAMNPFRIAKLFFTFTWPDLARWLRIPIFEKDTKDFFVGLVKEAIKFRQGNNCSRNDFLQLLFELGKESNGCGTEDGKKGLSVEELTAQVFIFFAAGFETSSGTLSFCLYELALNQDVQDKLRNEINEAVLKHDGQITYDAVMDMKYMNQVVSETLRKYPPVSFITRVSVEDYRVPGTDFEMPKGTECLVSILGVHRDPENYPNPDIFDPERFSEENKQRRQPFTYMPFGEGPRICIGLRFGLMQVTVGLMVLLQRYKFTLNKKTEVPLDLEPYSFTMSAKDGIFLNVERVGDVK